MKVAFINPIRDLDLTLRTGYYLLLTHLALKYPDYVQFWNKQEGYKVLDNSLIELGSAVSLEDVLRAAEILKVDEIVLPDIYLEEAATVRAVNKALHELHRLKVVDKYKLQAVAQGADASEWKRCWDLFNTVPEITCVAIPKVTETLFKGGRPAAVEYALANNPENKEIHLLGCWSDIKELESYSTTQREKIRGIDTSLTYHATIDYQYFVRGETSKPAYKINLEADYELDVNLLMENQRYTNILVS